MHGYVFLNCVPKMVLVSFFSPNFFPIIPSLLIFCFTGYFWFNSSASLWRTLQKPSGAHRTRLAQCDSEFARCSLGFYFCAILLLLLRLLLLLLQLHFFFTRCTGLIRGTARCMVVLESHLRDRVRLRSSQQPGARLGGALYTAGHCLSCVFNSCHCICSAGPNLTELRWTAKTRLASLGMFRLG